MSLDDSIGLFIRVRNFYKVQAYLRRAGLQYRGAFRDTIRVLLEDFRAYAASVTHRQTGTLARSHSVFYDSSRLSGYVYPSPSAVKPFNDPTRPGAGGRYLRASEYGPYEHRRGGSHAFYEMTARHMGPLVPIRGLAIFAARMPTGPIT